MQPVTQRRRPVDVVVVTPDTYTKVDFDAAEIVALAEESVAMVPEAGVGADQLELQIAENAATSTFAITSTDPPVFSLDSGALEDYKRPRELGELETKLSLVRLLLEMADRQDPEFGAPALDAEMSKAHHMAWDVYLWGRVARLGLRLHPPRFRYNFRNRHGFTDKADHAFGRLWAAEGLTWAEIVEISDRALSIGPDA